MINPEKILKILDKEIPTTIKTLKKELRVKEAKINPTLNMLVYLRKIRITKKGRTNAIYKF